MLEIYGTLGPACASADLLEQMLSTGMTGVRLNLSHVTLAQAADQVEALHTAARRLGVKPKLLIDMQGPELRIGPMSHDVHMIEGKNILLHQPGGIPLPEVILQHITPGQELWMDDGKIRVEVKTVNQRFLDIAFHTPKLLNAEEAHMRDRIKQTVARGKLDLFVTVEDLREKSAEIRVDRKLALAYHQALNEMSDLLRVARPDDVATIASYPDVLSVEETASFEGGEPVLDEALDKALSALDTMRQTEGENLKQDFLHRIETLSGFVEKLRTLAPDIVAHYRERLQATMDELLSAEDIDETRIIEETALYADKVNFTEEVVRLESHFAQFRAIIEGADAPVGRKLDFLIQEMNREANTIGSKCQSAEAAQTVVDMKSEIEKLREQVQNIE